MTDTPEAAENSLTLQQLEHLDSFGWLSLQIDSIWPELRKRALELETEKQFSMAQVAANTSNEIIRNDKTSWIENHSENAAEQRWLEFINHIQNQIKEHFRISLNNFETHFALYPKGHFYKKHSDQKQTDNKRQFSFVYYLNSEWTSEDGGQLVGYHQNTTEVLFQVTPLAGKFILFKSHIEHEVLISQSNRYSVTGWMRTL